MFIIVVKAHKLPAEEGNFMHEKRTEAKEVTFSHSVKDDEDDNDLHEGLLDEKCQHQEGIWR